MLTFTEVFRKYLPLMGKQTNRIEKKKRRQNYYKRKKAVAKAAVTKV